MKNLGILALVFVLTATLLTGCRAPVNDTTGATNNNTTNSTVRPEPTVTAPSTFTTPGTSGNARHGHHKPPMS